MAACLDEKFESLESILAEHLPADVLAKVNLSLRGPGSIDLELPAKAKETAKKNNFDLQGYEIKVGQKEQSRPSRLVRIGAIQNAIQKPTTASVQEQRDAIHERIDQMLAVAHECQVNVVCMQEAWNKMAACLDEKFESLESILAEHLPADVLAKVNLSLRGPGSIDLELPAKAKETAKKNNFDLQGYEIKVGQKEQSRPSRLVRIGAIQNAIQKPTTASVQEQRDAIHERIDQMLAVAHECQVNVVCMQEAWSEY
ncbi:unnamed protein product [Adineta steineri]|uniref:Uncharacterized protein n=1 Tax=Adineta steineri TaxID=433720 RepID=A0A813MFG5_9BILA|nr:unnamed protein product [Adineta steineri]